MTDCSVRSMFSIIGHNVEIVTWHGFDTVLRCCGDVESDYRYKCHDSQELMEAVMDVVKHCHISRSLPKGDC
jgi:hypothetical protein